MENDQIETADAPRRGRPPKVNHDTVNVTLLRNYVPRNAVPDESGVYHKHIPGDVLAVSVREGMYLCSHGIAKMDLEDVERD